MRRLRALIAATATAIVLMLMPASGASAADINQRFYEDVPPGGYVEECAELWGADSNGAPFQDPLTAVTAATYSYGGNCNNALVLSASKLYAKIYTQKSNGVTCHSESAYNAANTSFVATDQVSTSGCGSSVSYCPIGRYYRTGETPYPLENYHLCSGV